MNKTDFRFILILIALYVILLTTACSKLSINEPRNVSPDAKQNVADNDDNPENKNELLFPKNEKGRVWQIANQQLLERVQQFSREYYLIDGVQTKKVIWAPLDGEYLTNTANSVSFVGHGSGDGGIINFPFSICYDLDSGSYSVGKYDIGPKESLYWGIPGAKRVLRNFSVNDNAISLTFEADEPNPGEPDFGIPVFSPFTQEYFDSRSSEYVLCLYQTKISDQVSKGINELRLPQNEIILTIKIQVTDSPPLFIKPNYFWLHGITWENVAGNLQAVMIRVKVSDRTCFSSPSIPPSVNDLNYLSITKEDTYKLTLQFETLP